MSVAQNDDFYVNICIVVVEPTENWIYFSLFIYFSCFRKYVCIFFWMRKKKKHLKNIRKAQTQTNEKIESVMPIIMLISISPGKSWEQKKFTVPV